MMTSIVLIGAGGHGRVVADAAEACGYTSVAFLDDSWPERQSNGDWPVIGRVVTWSGLDAGKHIFVAIGDNALRLQIGRSVNSTRPSALPAIVHPSAQVSRRASIGPGSVIMAGAVVQAYAKIGSFTIINTGATVDHDCQIGDGVHISPGAHLAGTVSVGDGTWIGIGAVVREGQQIGQHALIGAGATVVQNVNDRQVVLGTPARAKRAH